MCMQDKCSQNNLNAYFPATPQNNKQQPQLYGIQIKEMGLAEDFFFKRLMF